jgi:hypothetical protein
MQSDKGGALARPKSSKNESLAGWHGTWIVLELTKAAGELTGRTCAMNTRSRINAVWLPPGLLVSASVIAQAPAIGQPPVATPGAEGPAPFYDPAQLPSFSGKVQQFTLSPRGEIDGVLLTDGTVLHLPPEAAANMRSLLQPGRAIVAQGDELSNPIGRVLEVRALGSSRADLTPIDGPPPPGPRGRPGGLRSDAPPPPPPGAG